MSFSGTNLWILVFAIFIASLGLNVTFDSGCDRRDARLAADRPDYGTRRAGAITINDLQLLKKALSNYAFASGRSPNHLDDIFPAIAAK